WVLSMTYHEQTKPGDVQICEAVRASSAFPGAFPPVKIKVNRLKLPSASTRGLQYIHLVDGGVRDNLGHIFQTRLLQPSAEHPNDEGKVKDLRDTLTRWGLTRLWIVVDASARVGVEDLSESVLSRIPIVRRVKQIVAFPRVLSIMNGSNSEA